jgi:shikimate kinase
MGSGKTSVGSALAEKLGWPLIDLDAEIVKSAGKEIGEIFEDSGEACFRQMELKSLKAILEDAPENIILALGGGTILQSEAAELIKKRCICIYLESDVQTLYSRLEGKSGRPLLSNKGALSKGPLLKERIEELMRSRSSAYKEASALSIKTDGLSAGEVVEEIRRKLEL